MNITKISIKMVEVPDRGDLVQRGFRRPGSLPVATIRLGTDEGVEGLDFAFSLGGLTRSLHGVLTELGDLLTGENPTRIEPILAKLRQAAGMASGGSLFLMAQAAVDTALWDIRGKVSRLALWRMAGGARDLVPGYASGQVSRDLTDHQAADTAVRLVEAGFSKIKFHLSLQKDFSPLREIRRAKAIRQAVGDDIELGCDVNCRWRLDQAMQVCGGLEEVRLSWIEDAVTFDDYEGMARLSGRFPTPFMAGKRNTGVTPFRLMLERRSVSIIMIDFIMVGGITNWLKIAGMAEAFNVPVVSHLVPEIQAHLVGGVPNGLMAEHKSWTCSLFEQTLSFAQGSFALPDQPGLGLTFDRRVYGNDW